MDIIITIALIILCVIGVILMKTGIDIQIKKEGLEHRIDLYKIWSGVTKEPSLCDKKAWEKDKIRVTGKPKGMNQR